MNFFPVLCFGLAALFWQPGCAATKEQGSRVKDEMKEWASRHDIDAQTLRVLREEGFTSLTLLRHLSSNDVTESFQRTKLLSVAQCLVLKKALQQLCDDGGFDDATPGETLAAKTYRNVAENIDYRFLLLGKTGSGKSTTGNTILGEEVFSVGNSFGSVTDMCELRRGGNLGKTMEIMDSPGLFDTKRTHDQISVDIVRSVVGMHPGPHAILYVIPIGRYTAEEYKVYTRLKALFDEHLTKYLIVVFTRGDSLKPGETIEEKLRAIPEGLKKVMEECGHRYVVFNNVADDTTPHVRELLRMVDAMNKSNGGQPYTCPKYDLVGQGLEEEVERRLAEVEKRDVERTKYVQRLQQEKQGAEQAAEAERENFQLKEKERRQEMKREQERWDRQVQELEKKMKEEKVSLEKKAEEERKLREKIEEEKKQQLKKMEGLVIVTSGKVKVTKVTDWSVVVEVAGDQVLVTTPGDEIGHMTWGGGSLKMDATSSKGRVIVKSPGAESLTIRTSDMGVVIEVLGRGGLTLGGMNEKFLLLVSNDDALTIVVSGEILGVE